GAGEGNRTLIVSLEGFCSTIELHPHIFKKKSAPSHNHLRETTFQSVQKLFLCYRSQYWWRGKDSNLRRLCRQIYSLIPLTAREPLQTKPVIMNISQQ